MKRVIIGLLIATLLLTIFGYAENGDEQAEQTGSGFFGWISGAASDVWDWTKGAADDVADWTAEAATDAWNWTTNAASDAWEWTSGAAIDAWNWTSGAATDAWNGVTGFFDPPSTEGIANVPSEPELPDGTLKMYLGYEVKKTGLNNGYTDEKNIGRDDPHFGISIGKFYVSGFSEALSMDDETFVFLKTAGDNVELHFQLAQDINMIGGDTFVTINSDDGGYDKYFGISPTYFGRGTLIVRHTDYQNNTGEPQIYEDYLEAKMSGDADTVITLNEEGDYEVALDYEIEKISYVLGLKIKRSSLTNYRLFFKFSVRNGNCMVFPFDVVTGAELRNTAVTENGFKLDLAYSRYLSINVQLTTLTEGAAGIVEDVRFNRPARDGEQYTQEGIYTISVANRYTGEQTVKQIYVGNDERLMEYVSNGYSIDQIKEVLNNN